MNVFLMVDWGGGDFVFVKEMWCLGYGEGGSIIIIEDGECSRLLLWVWWE